MDFVFVLLLATGVMVFFLTSWWFEKKLKELGLQCHGLWQNGLLKHQKLLEAEEQLATLQAKQDKIVRRYQELLLPKAEFNALTREQLDGLVHSLYDETPSPRHAHKLTERLIEASALFEFERASHKSEAICQSLNNQIVRAYHALPPWEAIRTIDTVWDMAERACELAAARSRLLLGKLPPLPSAGVPQWFQDAVEEWDEEDVAMLNPASKDAAIRVVGCVAARFPDLEATVSVGMLGRVTLDWHIRSARCNWMIDPTDLPFPSTRIYEARKIAKGKMQTRIIHDMHSALSALHEIID